MTRIRTGVIALLIAGCPFLARASDEAKEKAVTTALHLGTFSDMPAIERRELAVAALAYWKHFNSRIPRNSPADAAWLEQELNTTDMARISRAANTPAYALFELEGQSTNCVGIFDALVPNIGSNKVIELYLWLKATQCYSNSDTVRYLHAAGLSDGTYEGHSRCRPPVWS